MKILSIPNNKAVTIYGVTFSNVNDIIHYAIKRIPKSGVYVGSDCRHYPCFDASDYAYETRYYWNFVFAQSEAELERKMQQLVHNEKSHFNYCKLTEETPEELLPLIYYEGDRDDPLLVSDCPAVSAD